MSLLDRVQRKAEGTAPPTSAPNAPSSPAPSGAPDRPADDGADRFPPAGGQNRPAVAPAPVTPAPAPAPRPYEPERPTPAAEAQRAATLLTRSGGVPRPGLSKMGGHVNTHVALRGKV